MNLPTVSVVIPTVGRDSLRTSVRSVIGQKDCYATPVVVLDAPDRADDVNELLRGLRYDLHMSDRRGGSFARNIGLKAATASYIGYLDDDDYWLPHKAATQIAAIESSDDPSNTFSVARSAFRRQNGKYVTKGPAPFRPDKETLANHLVARRRLRFGAVCFNTPGIFGPASLIKAVRWDDSLKKHQDWDLLVRLAEGRDIAVVDDVLCIVQQGSVGSISKLNDWKVSYQWLTKHDGEVNGRPRSDFILLQMLLSAVRARSKEGIRRSFRELGHCPPHAAAIARFLAGIALNK